MSNPRFSAHVADKGEAVHAVNLDLGAVLALPKLCPACGSGQLAAALLRAEVVFTCGDCGGYWRPESGALVSVEGGLPKASPSASARIPTQRGSSCASG